MTRTPPPRKARPADAELRRKKARLFLTAARDGFALLGDADLADAVFSNIVLAAIAFTDALTARYAGAINQKDRAAASKLLRDALGDELPKEQSARLVRILGQKDEVQYGIRFKSRAEALRALEDLEKFAAWAETMLL